MCGKERPAIQPPQILPLTLALLELFMAAQVILDRAAEGKKRKREESQRRAQERALGQAYGTAT